jgi:hypothetical protein
MSSIIAKNEPSIFISHVFPNKAGNVESVFLELFGSCIDKVDIVTHKTSNGEDICRAYVHFKWWPNTPEASALREKLLNGDSIKVYYEKPWFWKCVASKFKEGNNNSGSASQRTGPYIELDDQQFERVCSTDEIRQQSQQREFRGPPREQREFRGPPREQREFRGPPRDQREFRGPPREQREFRGPPREQREFRGYYREERDVYQAPPAERKFREPSARIVKKIMVPRQVKQKNRDAGAGAGASDSSLRNWDESSDDDIPPPPRPQRIRRCESYVQMTEEEHKRFMEIEHPKITEFLANPTEVLNREVAAHEARTASASQQASSIKTTQTTKDDDSDNTEDDD